ncbi:2028_t:CDS:1, partial [Ambispora gerdemannii]
KEQTAHNTTKTQKDAIITTLTTERDSLKTELAQEKETRQTAENNLKLAQEEIKNQEQEIAQRLNKDLKLGLKSSEINLERVISKLRELLDKPNSVNEENLAQQLAAAQNTIQELKKQLKGENLDYTAIQQAEYQKILQLVKNDTWKTCQKLNISVSHSVKKLVQKATTLETVITERNKLIAAKLAEQGQIITGQKGQLIKE